MFFTRCALLVCRLKAQKGGFLNNDIKWNFSKFLLDREGNVVGR